MAFTWQSRRSHQRVRTDCYALRRATFTRSSRVSFVERSPLWRSCRGRRCSFFGEEAQQQCPDSVLGRHKCDNNRDKRDWKEIAVTQEESLKYQGYPRDKAIVPPRTSRMAAVGSERYDMDRGTVSVSTSRLDLPSRT